MRVKKKKPTQSLSLILKIKLIQYEANIHCLPSKYMNMNKENTVLELCFSSPSFSSHGMIGKPPHMYIRLINHMKQTKGDVNCSYHDTKEMHKTRSPKLGTREK